MAIEDIIVVHNFITEEENQMLLDYEKYLDENGLWDVGDKKGDPNGQWTNRFLGTFSLRMAEKGFGKPKDLQIYNLLVDIRNRIAKQIVESYNLDFPVYPDSLNLIKWPHGYIQPAHSDFENYGGEPHVYNWREIGCVLYLNDNFNGGEIHFPQHGVQIPVKPGMLAFFPGDVHHSHGVNRVLNGTRYTVSSFWTQHEKYWDRLDKVEIGDINA